MATTSSLGDIPIYRIDLGQSPELRYVKLATDFAERMQAVAPLFDEVLECFLIPKHMIRLLKLVSRIALRKVFDDEQTREIKAIAKVAGIDRYLVVALNVFLDLLLGCTSGAILTRPESAHTTKEHISDRLIHFRTLEWDMGSLRSLLVVLEFVDSRKAEPGRVIARSVTYAGFVGVLTGVRQNLSLSLNHRPVHDCNDSSLRRHQLLVVLGIRESISSVLRRALMSENDDDNMSATKDGRVPEKRPDRLSQIATKAKELASRTTSPCYVTLCDGKDVAIVLKDLTDGKVKTSSYFMIQTNHDVEHGSCCSHKTKKPESSELHVEYLGGDEWLAESQDRLGALQSRWLGHVKAHSDDPSVTSLASGNGICLDSPQAQLNDRLTLSGISERRLLKWVRSPPTTNNLTHFSCLMDPHTGEIRGLTRGPDPSSIE
ncbi:uncharacterized protein CTRU02_205106 [Colletotrichum truncatum]|uniref:Uncharacterized protein n=1 Tax=Colletotrichum truncatum TaxID=5467 RepID=A0ACC3Z328_COLTU|nr:uncharacterized protein CTRU02_06064 [Colletotrichum truncatum]KAF6793192.1 hypothetical protein CTRU02_06064 [Colletotrichum truncatum]